MSESILTLLKFCFLALLYLFLFRVVRLTVAEMKTPAPVVTDVAAAAAPAPAPRKTRRSGGKGTLRVRILEPVARQGETHTLDHEITVGRGGGCAIVLTDDGFVSQVHARLYEQGGEAYVEDLGSTNGSFVNGKQVTAVTQLRRGDRVQFGQTVMEILR